MVKSYLALGDSYTIGEQVLLTESFPYQTVQKLRNAGSIFNAPEIIAKTGWSTDELYVHIMEYSFLETYDLVSLLIGVNNQYRGRPVNDFVAEFEKLLKLSIHYSGNKPQHVFVLSIPDWGLTPFAVGKDGNNIASEIDAYNEVCSNKALEYGCNFIDTTTTQRRDATNAIAGLVAEDGLHPSGKAYEKWATLLASEILK